MTVSLKDDKQKLEVLETWELTLYISGQSPKSRNTLSALEKICDEYLRGKCHDRSHRFTKNSSVCDGGSNFGNSNDYSEKSKAH